MCGINGVYSKTKDRQASFKLSKMNNAIIHRGPDDEGNYVNDNVNYSLAMGMRRLSIIDINSGRQPVYSIDKSKVLVFNGEIYNYKELKIKLTKKGSVFFTNSDTEVIMRLYEEYGNSSFSMLDGMFAFSIYDITLNKIIVVRDFFGEKPLYYCKTNDHFYWASELKSIKKVSNKNFNISKRAVSLFFQLTYIPAPHTIYEDVYKLEANSILEFDCVKNDIKITKIKRSKKNSNNYSGLTFSDAKTKTRELVYNSVNSRSVSDVPIGAFLSGGVDSSIISHCLNENVTSKINTFSIGFTKKSFDETKKSRQVAKLIGSNHHEFILSDKDLVDDLDKILSNYDEPFADPSALPTYMLSKHTSQQVKVALTGDGGDEMFGGYNKYYVGKINNLYTKYISEITHAKILSFSSKFLNQKKDSRGLIFKSNKLLKSINYENNFYFNIISLGFQRNELLNILKLNNDELDVLSSYNKCGDLINDLQKFREVDRRLSLEGDLLVKVDRASMLASIECRAPFLDIKILDFVEQLPEKYLLNGWNKKYLLKESFKDVFPKKFLDKSKQGFAVPVGDWLKLSFKKELLSFIERDFLITQGLFNVDYITELIMNHLNSSIDNTYKVWTFYCFQKWYVHNYS